MPNATRLALCGHDAPYSPGPPRKKCPTCAAFRPARACPECGRDITNTDTRRRYCSRFCSDVFRGRRLSKPYDQRTCALVRCGAPFTPKHKNQECCSEAHGKAHFRAKAKAEGRRWPGKPETRRANLRRKTQQRRARTKGDPLAELIDRDEVGARDGWRCALCSKSVDRSLAYPDPRSASLDHIVPLSLSGTHVMANVQISHLSCNVAKSNRVADVQLLLVG